MCLVMSLNTIGNNRLEIHSADEERGDSVMVSGEGYEQLDLSDAKDITEFRNNIDNLYVAATELTATAEKDSYRLVAFEDVTGSKSLSCCIKNIPSFRLRSTNWRMTYLVMKMFVKCRYSIITLICFTITFTTHMAAQSARYLGKTQRR